MTKVSAISNNNHVKSFISKDFVFAIVVNLSITLDFLFGLNTFLLQLYIFNMSNNAELPHRSAEKQHAPSRADEVSSVSI